MFTLLSLPTLAIVFFAEASVDGIKDTFNRRCGLYLGFLLWAVAIDCIAVLVLGVKS